MFRCWKRIGGGQEQLLQYRKVQSTGDTGRCKTMGLMPRRKDETFPLIEALPVYLLKRIV